MVEVNWPEERILFTTVNMYMEYILMGHQDFLKNMLRDENITLGEFTYLFNISYSGPLSQRQLSELLFVSEANVTKFVKKLEKKGYIQRRQSKDNKSKKIVYLTEEGKLLVYRLTQLNSKWEEKVTVDITDDELNTFKHILYKLSLNTADL